MAMLVTVIDLLVFADPTAHVPPGNLHLNVVANSYTPEIQDALEPYVYEVVGQYLPKIEARRISHLGPF